jgi:hypothetical protein
MDYLLPSRATTEGCENQFSSARQDSGEQNPGPLKTKQTLRKDALTHSVAHPRGANYGAVCDVTALTLSDLGEKIIQDDTNLEVPVNRPHNSFHLQQHSQLTKKGLNSFLTIQKS